MKFSNYAIEVKCTTADTDGKGCCLQDMSEDANGGWCLLQSGTGATASMDTYRLNWSAMGEFTKDGSAGGASKIINSKVTEGSGAIEGLDVFGCSFEGGTWTCAAFQPGWLEGQEQGYPRFGDGMNARASLMGPAPTSVHVQLMGAATLGYIGLAIVALGYLF